MLFRILLGIDVLTALVVAGFFLVGLSDRSISAFNIGLWIGIVFTVAVIIAGGVALHRSGKPVIANIVLATLALPALLYGGFIVAFVTSGTQWK